MITIALSKGRIFEETLPLLKAAGITPLEDPETSRKLILPTNRDDVRLIIVRASDVPTYVQYGAADMGVAGKDVLNEHGGDGLYQPLDLNIAKCRMMVAVRKGFDYESAVKQGARLRVATKYVKTAREHFASKGVHVDLIKLYGSMELAPLVGLSDAIVDLVSSGATLKANNLVAVEEIAQISSRLVVNQASLKLKRSNDSADAGCLCRSSSMNITRLSTQQADFDATLNKLLAFEETADEKLEATVASILADVKKRGNAAVLEYTRKFDRLPSIRCSFDGIAAVRIESGIRWLACRPEDCAGTSRAARHCLSPETGASFVDYMKTRRHHARPAGHSAGSRRSVRARRQGGLSVFRVDECAACQSGGCGRTHHGRAHSGWCEESTGAGSGPSVRCGSRVHHRRCASRGCTGLWHGRPSPRWTRSSAPAMPMWPRPSAACSACAAST